MAKVELTLEQARAQSANLMYIFASDAYLAAIDPKYRAIIKGKRANQRKILVLSAQQFINRDAVYGGSEYNQYVDAVKKGFTDTYGMTPLDALVKLAMGENVAGKNWSEGVYGIGATREFSGTDISVDPQTGYFMQNGQYLPKNDDSTVYKQMGKKGAVAFQRFYTDSDTGRVYMSEYNKLTKKYNAKSYSVDGVTYSAKTGKEQTKLDAGTVWENIKFGTFDFLEWLKSILAFFGINFGGSGETINEENTLPNQQADGYTQEAGMSEAAVIALLAVAGSTLLAGGLRGSKKKRK